MTYRTKFNPDTYGTENKSKRSNVQHLNKLQVTTFSASHESKDSLLSELPVGSIRPYRCPPFWNFEFCGEACKHFLASFWTSRTKSPYFWLGENTPHLQSKFGALDSWRQFQRTSNLSGTTANTSKTSWWRSTLGSVMFAHWSRKNIGTGWYSASVLSRVCKTRLTKYHIDLPVVQEGGQNATFFFLEWQTRYFQSEEGKLTRVPFLNVVCPEQIFVFRFPPNPNVHNHSKSKQYIQIHSSRKNGPLHVSQVDTINSVWSCSVWLWLWFSNKFTLLKSTKWRNWIVKRTKGVNIKHELLKLKYRQVSNRVGCIYTLRDASSLASIKALFWTQQQFK